VAGGEAARNGPDPREKLEDAVHVAVGAVLLLVNRLQVQRRRFERNLRAGRTDRRDEPARDQI
jgi:hypothetical protein